jgi:hypothetical protein
LVEELEQVGRGHLAARLDLRRAVVESAWRLAAHGGTCVLWAGAVELARVGARRRRSEVGRHHGVAVIGALLVALLLLVTVDRRVHVLGALDGMSVAGRWVLR